MPISHSESLSIQSVRIHFDRGFSERPKAFYDRLNLRDWLDTLDWLFAEASDRLDELEGREAASTSLPTGNKVSSPPIGGNEAIERERNILEMLEDEIREADRQYCRLALYQR